MRVSELPPDGPGGWADMHAVRLDDAGLCWLNTDATVYPKPVLGECVQVVRLKTTDPEYRVNLDNCPRGAWVPQPAPTSPEWVRADVRSAWSGA